MTTTVYWSVMVVVVLLLTVGLLGDALLMSPRVSRHSSPSVRRRSGARDPASRDIASLPAHGNAASIIVGVEDEKCQEGASQPYDITSPPLADNKVKVTLNINGSSSSEVVIVQFDSVSRVYQLYTGIDKGCIRAPTINIRVSDKARGRHTDAVNPPNQNGLQAKHGDSGHLKPVSPVPQYVSSRSQGNVNDHQSSGKRGGSGLITRHDPASETDSSSASVQSAQESEGLAPRSHGRLHVDGRTAHASAGELSGQEKSYSHLSASASKSDQRSSSGSSKLHRGGHSLRGEQRRQEKGLDRRAQRHESVLSSSGSTEKPTSVDSTVLEQQQLHLETAVRGEDNDRSNGQIDSGPAQTEQKREGVHRRHKDKRTGKKNNHNSKDSQDKHEARSSGATKSEKSLDDNKKVVSSQTGNGPKGKSFSSKVSTDVKTNRTAEPRAKNVRLSKDRGGRQPKGEDIGWQEGDLSDIVEYAGDFPRRPAAADRLERRMSPKLGETSRSLLQSINRVMGVVSNQMHYVHNDNDYVFNGTRYIIMAGVREQLKEIAKASDLAYDAVLRATLLTKDIYIRAHRGRLTGPTTRSLSRPEMSLPSLYTFISKAYSEDRDAQQMLRDIHNYKRQQQKIQVRLRQLREKLQDNHAPNSLRTVVYYVNMTNHKLRNELNYANRMRNGKRNNVMLGERRNDLLIARDLLAKADDHLTKGSQDYRGNYQVVQDFLRLSAGQDEDNVGPPVSLRRRPLDNDVTADERRQILQIIDRVREHVRQQEERATQIERLLQPAIRRSHLLTKREGAREAVLLTVIRDRLTTDGKKLFSLLDGLRVLVGSQQELTWRPPSEWLGRVEGSGDDEDDDDDYDGCGSGETRTDYSSIDDEDFVFVDEKKPSKRPSSSSAMAEFGEKLSVYLNGVNLRSNDVVQRADQVYDKTTEASKRWQSVEKLTEDTATAYKNWKDLKPIVQNFIVHADNTSKMARDLSERVSRFHSSVKERMDRAVHISERALAEATVNKTGQSPGQPETDKVASDDTSVIIEAFQKVSEVRSNTQAIANIRKVLPRTCDQASRQIQALRANISHLRLQVQRARALLQSMQLSVAKTGNGYLSIPVVHDDITPSLTTTIDVCVRTEKSDGPILFVKGNNSVSLSLSLEKKKALVTAYDTNGKVLNKVSSDLTLAEDKWYDIRVSRAGTSLSLHVASKDGKEVTETDIKVSDIALLQPHPIHAYIGGVSETEPFSLSHDVWTGCLAGLKVNSQAVPLLHTSSEGETPQLCTSQCSETHGGSSLVFEGAGFLHFSATVLPQRRTVQTVHLKFRTLQSSAALLHVVNQRQRFLLRVVLDGGAVMIDTTTPSESVILRSRQNNFTDGNFHTLKIKYSDSTTYPELDGKDGAFTIEKGTPRLLTGMADGVVAGAFVTSQHGFEKSNYRPLIGCLQKLEIDNKPLSKEQADHAIGVFVGTCHQERVWSSCVQFDINSKGIDLGTFDKSDIVAVLFSPNARGTLLSYTREGKFQAEISSTESGLHISTGDKDVTLKRPDGITEPLSLLTITDDGKNVRYKAWGESKDTNYAGFWSIASDINGPHQITVGPDVNDPQHSLVGDVAQLVIGNRYINLANYAHTNDLQTCQRPLPETSNMKLPILVGADLTETCSLEFAC